ncbi:MAG: calcium/sodium antiporter [Candidatus Aenigmarchaeota archaeon]|nr:calcium/sodium antiporter [Candidatus Aenigmarchaeota archaeon]
MIILSAIGILVSSLVIYYAGEHFATASSFMGDYMGISRSAKGATFDAISSSMPELLIALFSVILFSKFEIGVGTIVGSALFNILIIPSLCAFVSPKIFKVSDDVIHRDGLFYVLTVIILMMVMFYNVRWSMYVGILFIATYILYFLEIFRHGTAKNYGRRLLKFIRLGPSYKHVSKVRKNQKKLHHEILILIISLVFIIISSYFLVKYSLILATTLGIPPIIIAFVITAAATSIPDLVISVADARKGDISSATSNVFGSNIFDILIGLGLPVLIATLMGINIEITPMSLFILFGLLVSTVVTLYILAENMKLTKPRAILLILMYITLVSYIVIVS